MPSVPPPSWFDRQPRIAKLVALGFGLLLAELGMRLFVAVGVLPFALYPTTRTPTYWDDIDPVIGVWRYPNAELHAKAACYDVTYRSNSYGARDIERSLRGAAPERVVVLGDSFVEGLGVDAPARFTDLLEKRTGIEHLNFGIAGNFGSVQEWLLYESRASRFDHSDVFVFLLPFNDFDDNDPKGQDATRYRPYLRPNDAGYEVFYTVPFADRRRETRGTAAIARNTVVNHVYVANALRLLVGSAQGALGEPLPRSLRSPSYDAFDDRDLDVVLYSYDRIARDAGDRRLWVFTIPHLADFEAAGVEGHEFKIVRALERFAAERPNVRYVDLLPAMRRYALAHGLTPEAFTLGCDGHWGPLGHQVAAEAIYDAVYGTAHP